MIEGPATFLLAIFGCGEGESACQQVQVAPVRYESQAACLAATEEQLVRHSDLAFPVVVAECRRANEVRVPLQANAVRLPQPRGSLPIRTASASR